MIGDSIIFFAGKTISSAVPTTYHVAQHAEIGHRIDQVLPAVRSAARGKPYAIVIDLGTNDALQAGSHPDWRSAFDEMIALLRDQHCVLLTTVNTSLPALGARAVAVGINAAERSVATQHPNFHIVDWNAAVHRPNGDTLLLPDRVHPSPAGQLVLARQIADQLAACA